MLVPRALAKTLPGLARIPLHGPWYRAVNHDYLLAPPPGAPSGSVLQPLWPGGAARKGARFTPCATSSTADINYLYPAQDELTPLLAVTGVQVAFATGTVVGLRYPSSKNPNGVGVVVFTGRLQPGRHHFTLFNRKGAALQQALP